MVDRLLGFVLMVVASAVVGSCTPNAIASVLPIAPGPLVTVTSRGGECPEGLCTSVIVIERDGRVHRLAPQVEDLGVAPADVLVALDAALRTTDFDAVRAHPFTGTCPTAYDGQEIVYEFGAPGGVERIASCETEIDQDAPAFATVSTVLRAVAAEPAS